MKNNRLNAFKIIITDEDKNNKLAEEYQSSNLEMALLNKNNKQVTGFVKCRDFFNDTLYSFINNINFGVIYSHKSDGTDEINCPSIERVKLCVRLTDKVKRDDANKIIIIALNMVNYLEDYWDIKEKSFICRGKIKEFNGIHSNYHFYYFEGPNDWLLNSAKLSLYTFIIRLSEVIYSYYTKFYLTEPIDIKKTIVDDKHIEILLNNSSEVAYTYHDFIKVFKFIHDRSTCSKCLDFIKYKDIKYLKEFSKENLLNFLYLVKTSNKHCTEIDIFGKRLVVSNEMVRSNTNTPTINQVHNNGGILSLIARNNYFCKGTPNFIIKINKLKEEIASLKEEI